MKTNHLHFLNKSSYRWTFCSMGGTVRVKISTGDDITHLNELDRKLWTVLSCPVEGIHFNKRTLEYLDTDHDGKIKVDEVIAASQWLSKVLKDMDLLLDGSESLPLSNIDTSTDDGIALFNAAQKLQKCLGLTEDNISARDTHDFATIFSNTAFNGDGIITLISCDDPLDQKAFKACVATTGHTTDLSGNEGIDAEQIESFYTALGDWAEWVQKTQSNPEILPFGDKTESAVARINATAEKIDDYFMRCGLIAFDSTAQNAVCASAEKISVVANAGLIDSNTAEVLAAPLAKPRQEAVLPYDGINPAWKEAFEAVRSEVFDKEYPGAKELKQEQWEALKAKIVPFNSWIGSKKGAQVESLGLDTVKELLKDKRKESLLELIAKDNAQACYLQSLKDLDKLVHFNQYFYGFIRNYVTFNDFYSVKKELPASFEEGRLYIDQRCCALCVRVSDMNTHADMSGLSGMYLLYCTCKRQGEQPIDIVAVLTAGGIKNLRTGMNAIFYDRHGNVWDATVIKIVDNPISLSQAFWDPYRKFAKFVGEKIKKSANEKNEKAVSDLNNAASEDLAAMSASPDGAQAPKPRFDIAKFAGIFAAIGMAIGYIGAFLTTAIEGVTAAPLWKTILVIIAIILVISGPSCFLAGIKLHRRNLGPVLNANGWAINSDVIVNILFGATLTSVAKYPKISPDDPFATKSMPWWQIALIVLGILIILGAGLYFSGCLDSIIGGAHE